ncbi:MAG TPA: zinc ribbon domain-containing protein [Blastocatellia bacterium]|nr:zinc ribbon domain-containing protein [Blastocatellia bacterium]
MHCPNCGKKATLDQKYCRSCGMTLDWVSRFLTQYRSSQPVQTRAQRDRQIAGQMAKTLFSGVVMLVAGMALLAVGKDGALHWLGLTAVLFAVLTAAYAVISPMWKAGAGRDAEVRATNELPALNRESFTFLPERREPVPVPSVTEPTTELLPVGGVNAHPNSGEDTTATR